MIKDIGTDVGLKVKQARVKLLLGQPFFGTLIMHLPLVDATDAGWCPTAAVDGKNIYYNRDFFKTLSVDEIQFVLCHEVLHVAYDHFGRRSHRDPSWWNMANDYVINATLMNEGIGSMPMKPVTSSDGKGGTSQRVGLYNKKYEGWTSEAVYDDLEKRKAKKELTLDVHLEAGKDGKNSQNGIPIDISEEDLKAIRDAMKANILNAATAAMSAGKMPASLRRIVDDLVEPKINWKDLIKQSVQSCLTDDFTWMRPNRKHMYSGIFLPTLDKDETVEVEVAIDMSGSITDRMGKDFISEIYGIMQQYADFKLGVLTFDTAVYNHQTFTKTNMDELLNYNIVGGGGTDFSCFWNYWRDNLIVPKLALVFTDGFPFGTWGPESYCDTLWIITEGARTKVKPPFGRFAYFDHGSGIEEIG